MWGAYEIISVSYQFKGVCAMNKERRSFLDMVKASALSPLLGFSSPASAQNKQPEELWLDAFKTNIAVKGEYCWIDDDRFVVTTNMPGLELELEDEFVYKSNMRLAIVNFSDKSIIYVENNTEIIKFNRSDKSMLIGHLYLDRQTPDPRFGPNSKKLIFMNLRLIKINSNNIVEVIETFPDGTEPSYFVKNYPKGVRFEPVDGGVEGYLIED